MSEWNIVAWTFIVFGAMVAMTIYRKKQNDMTTFSWRNYTKPTPRNVLRMAEFIQGVLLGVSTLSVIMERPVVAISVNLAMVVVNRAVMFFGDIADDSQTESVTTEFPSGEEVTVTHEKPKEDTNPAA